ncbi:hypothetical protein ACGFWD_19310 [Streptomyces sp. NPDC048448]|uniref:hypothetical protein n=1 Tax=unclassified Streptomyces TaxID=2593676 RepID=UPI0034139667
MARDSFPPDLVELHLACVRTYRALAGASPGQGARLRRDVVRLHARLLHHPYWSLRVGSPSVGWAALRHQLQAAGAGRERERGGSGTV